MNDGQRKFKEVKELKFIVRNNCGCQDLIIANLRFAEKFILVKTEAL